MGRRSAAMEAYRGVPSVIGSPSLCAACKSAASVPVAPDSQAKLSTGTQVVKVVSMMQPWSQPSLSVRTMYPVVGSSCRGELGEARCRRVEALTRWMRSATNSVLRGLSYTVALQSSDSVLLAAAADTLP
jgi:hypothetical protein